MKNEQPKKLIFIYNADSGLRNLVIDSMHKVISPKTYDCNLCDITFGVFTENKIWKKFREATQFEIEFLHKDEFKKQYASKFGYKFSYPIILAATENDLEVFVGTKELNTMMNAEDLVTLINKRAEI